MSRPDSAPHRPFVPAFHDPRLSCCTADDSSAQAVAAQHQRTLSTASRALTGYHTVPLAIVPHHTGLFAPNFLPPTEHSPRTRPVTSGCISLHLALPCSRPGSHRMGRGPWIGCPRCPNYELHRHDDVRTRPSLSFGSSRSRWCHARGSSPGGHGPTSTRARISSPWPPVPDVSLDGSCRRAQSPMSPS